MNATTLSAESDRENEAIAQIDAVIKGMIESWNRHDMVSYAAFFAENADFVNVLGMRQRGRAEIEARHVELHRTIFRNSALRLVEDSMRFVGSGVALAWIRWEMRGHERMAGWNLPETRAGIMTIVLVEEPDGWRISAAHNTDTVPLPIY